MRTTPLALLGLFSAFVSLSLHATTFVVTSTAPDGPGSLGQAILDANAAPGADTIGFNLTGTPAITLSVSLPAITEAVVIDATTQPGYAGIPLVVINGNFRRNVTGLTLNTTACTVRGLAIVNCGTSGGTQPMWGVVIEGGGGHRIEGCYLGLDPDGTTAKRNRDGGILLSNSVDNVIGGVTTATRNVVSGNTGSGVVIAGPGTSNNVVQGNFIGLTADGNSASANGGAGIEVREGAAANRVGGPETSARNVMIGKVGGAVETMGSSGTLVRGNWIGLRADGKLLQATPLFSHGVAFRDSVNGLVVSNVISGNQFGVLITGAGASNNVVQGNLIGTDPTGQAARPNQLGVLVSSLAADNLIGGPEAAARNVISGNVTSGVSLNEASRNRVQGNYIGTDLTGLVALGNGKPGAGSAGISVFANSTPAIDNQIGGPGPAMRNVISGNLVPGVTVTGLTAQQTRIQGNFIGLAADGTTRLGNQADGIVVLGATDTRIGAPPIVVAPGSHGPQRAEPPPALSALGNWIYANAGNGVAIKNTFGATGAPAVRTTVIGNLVIANQQNGINELVGALISQNIILPPAVVPLNWQPIDWKGDGVSNPNSPDNAVNFPVITLATFNPATSELLIKGNLQVPHTADLPVQLEFFTSPEAAPTVQRTFAGFEKTFTDGSGMQSFELRVPFTAFTPESVAGVAIVGDLNGQFETGQESPLATVTPAAPCPDLVVRILSGSHELGVVDEETTLPYYPPAAAGLFVTAEGGTPPYHFRVYIDQVTSDEATGDSLALQTVANRLANGFPAQLFVAVSDSKGCRFMRYVNLKPVEHPVGFRRSGTGTLQLTWPAAFGDLDVETTRQLGPQALWVPLVNPVRFVDGDVRGIDAPANVDAGNETYFRALFP